MPTAAKKNLPAAEREDLLTTLKGRFDQNHRDPTLHWDDVHERLESNAAALRTIHEMERTGGEPEVIGRDEATGEHLFVDCSAESPKGRRSLCYDREAWEARKQHKPGGSAVELATAMGAALLTEQEYRRLQELGEFDTKTSSWLETPPEIRGLGGAIFGDRRFGAVWIYHNGAESYYGARGFRCILRV
jgi:hypothetical protein